MTSPIRAPFTEFEESGGPAEVEERPRGTGLRRAVGELLTCPYCLGVWTAGALNCALVVAPAWTRLVARIFTAAAVADFLQALYVVATAKAEEA